MNQTFGQCSLYLCPDQHDFMPDDILSFISALQNINFISQPINTKVSDYRFFTGNSFLDFIAYMGCAPAIQFEASENSSAFCFIKIHHYESAQLIYNQKQARAPHCPQCNKPVSNWQQNKISTTIPCDHCHTTFNIENFNWRKMAGYAQLFIEITDIFPKEAIPQQLLLDKLLSITNIDWQYFYSCH